VPTEAAHHHPRASIVAEILPLIPSCERAASRSFAKECAAAMSRATAALLNAHGTILRLASLVQVYRARMHTKFSQVNGAQHCTVSTQDSAKRLHRWVSFSRRVKFLGRFEENDNEV